jgi:hypothetical protein
MVMFDPLQCLADRRQGLHLKVRVSLCPRSRVGAAGISSREWTSDHCRLVQIPIAVRRHTASSPGRSPEQGTSSAHPSQAAAMSDRRNGGSRGQTAMHPTTTPSG